MSRPLWIEIRFPTRSDDTKLKTDSPGHGTSLVEDGGERPRVYYALKEGESLLEKLKGHCTDLIRPI